MSSLLRPPPSSSSLRSSLFLCPSPSACLPVPGPGNQEGPEGQEGRQEKPVRITEEILVVGKSPKDVPLATVSTVVATEIDKLKPRDLSDVVKFIPGSMVTFGDKDTYNLKLRGIGSNRIALLVDGVPVYEPYFSTFDLKTVSAGGIDTVQVTKGPSSVLYGPNTLGGLVNVITRRPSAEPSLSLTGSYGDKAHEGPGRRRVVRLEAVLARGQRPLPGLGRLLLSRSRRPARPCGPTATSSASTSAPSSITRPRARPRSWSTAALYQSEYGMPPALFTQRARYWRFPKWDRSTLNAGGFTSLGGDAVLRFRGFLRQLQQHARLVRRPGDDRARLSSTYDNSVYGGFALADIPTGEQEHGQGQPALPEGHRPHPGRHRPALGHGSTRGRSRPGSRTISASPTSGRSSAA